MALVIARACEDGSTRQMVPDLGIEPVAPPKQMRLILWEYDVEMYKRRNNEVERLFRRLKGRQRTFSRFESSM